MIMSSTIIDEGASVSILSSTAWIALGSPSLLLENRNLLGFNKGTSRLLGNLPNSLITLRRKTIHLNMMVVQRPLDYNLLLGCDYVYSMGANVSTLFWLTCFPHEGKMVQIVDQLSFPGSNTTTSQTPSLNGLFTSRMSLQPLVHPTNYHE